MIKIVDITDSEVAEEVLNIQIPSYNNEAELTDFFELPPLKDTVHSLQQCEETFFGYYLGEELCGAISVKVVNRVIDIHRLMVHPDHFRKRIATTLLRFIEEGADFEAMTVSTGSANEPAVNFYLKHGFVKTGESKITKDFSITSFKKML
ncbi:GNAT family N-acetyltransferase [Salimicrobium jeotgali]|uniref:GNAT family N-acetyltransferase n=1 Tax=Salimicrobium jeotgali TaxID=1230341 RepID=K2GQP7_9BACI|nr:GNAT family N-acetyltransferase [Salimicrobium jeotgali]AKG04480.1 GNAT family N-acetyltransferase [Salimicrobium jeotgali]EKE32689.1 N-acetyltransferase GCN5 [Salimicrobium jeotgali]MBM7695325.1 ribosomal protein S18 acetylase RimI-like enzyme [Salimicrobium jeotgali]